MKKIIWGNDTLLFMLMLAGAFAVSAGIAFAAGQERMQQETQTQMQEQEQIYGSQIMSEEELMEYRTRMRAATSAEEREKIRNEHHERMKERARGQGITLPDEPPERGMGRGMGPGGGGMGPGGRNR